MRLKVCLALLGVLCTATLPAVAVAQQAATARVQTASAARAQVSAMFAAAAARYNAPGTSDAQKTAIAEALSQQVAAFVIANPDFASEIAAAVAAQPASPLTVAVLSSTPAALSQNTEGGSQSTAASFLSNLSSGLQAGSAPSGGGSASVSPNG